MLPSFQFVCVKEHPKKCVVGVATLSSVVHNWKRVLDGDLIMYS